MNLQSHLRLASLLSRLLDNQFRILGIKFGFDPLLGIVPGAGDLVSLVLGLYVIWIGWKMKIGKEDLVKMVRNQVFDFAIGLLPGVGDIADFVFKAHAKNVSILRKHSTVIEGEVVD